MRMRRRRKEPSEDVSVDVDICAMNNQSGNYANKCADFAMMLEIMTVALCWR